MAHQLSPRPTEEWSIDELIRRVEKLTGRRIQVMPVDTTAVTGVCGSRMQVGDTDVICVPRSDETGSLSVELVTVHELAHVACGHKALSQDNANRLLETLRRVWQGIPSSVVESVVNDEQAAREEEEAELLSALILKNAQPPSAFGTVLQSFRDQRGVHLRSLFGDMSNANLN